MSDDGGAGGGGKDGKDGVTAGNAGNGGIEKKDSVKEKGTEEKASGATGGPLISVEIQVTH